MARPPSILSQVICAAAHRLAQHPSIPEANRQAFMITAESVMHAQWSSMFGGETVKVRVYAPAISSAFREQRRERIVAAMRAGAKAGDIARAEGVSTRWVRKVWTAELSGMESSAVAGQHQPIESLKR